MSFTDGKFMVKGNGFIISTSHASPPPQKESCFPAYKAGSASTHQGRYNDLIRTSNPDNHFYLSFKSALTLSEFNDFVRQNRMEKLSQVIRQDKKYEDAATIEVHQAILEDYKDQFGDLL